MVKLVEIRKGKAEPEDIEKEYAGYITSGITSYLVDR